MKKTDISQVTTADLVLRFAQIGVMQDKALLGGQTARFNRLFDQKTLVLNELKYREGDHRRELMSLYEYPNMQVCLNAAKSTLAVAPVEARRQLEAIAQSQWFPQAGDAGMSLALLDDGTYKPT